MLGWGSASVVQRELCAPGITRSSISIADPAGNVARKLASRVCPSSSVVKVDGSTGSVWLAARCRTSALVVEARVTYASSIYSPRTDPPWRLF